MRLCKHIWVFAVALCLLCGSKAFGQEQKIGYVDTDLILSKIPEYQSIERELDLLSTGWRNRLDEMQKEIQQLREDFSSREILFTDEIRKQREQEIERKVKQRQQYLEQKFGPEGEYFKQQQALLEPIQRRVFEAISVIAKQESFDFIFDRSQNSALLFSNKEWNLNNDVLTELGLSVDEISN